MPQRIAIVGTGASGLALAFRLCLAPRPPRVVVYGPSDLNGAYAGSTAAPAMVNVLGEITTRIRTSWAARHMLEIGEAAMALWPEFRDRLNGALDGSGRPPVELHAGTYVLARRGADDESGNLAAMIETLAGRGHPVEELDLGRPLRHEVVRPDRFARGVFLPGELFLSAGKLVGGLRTALEGQPNVTFREAMVEDVDAVRRAVRDETGAEERYDAVVLANSFGFSELADRLGVVGVPLMIPVYGVGMTLPYRARDPYAVRTPTYGSSCGDYAVHYPGHLYVGASAISNTSRVEITTHLQRALDFFDPDANLNDVHLTGGIRAMSQDTYPVLGELLPGIIAAAGFYKSGVTLAPYTAELIARELLGEPPLIENRFVPLRRTDERRPGLGDLVETVWSEIVASGTSSGSRAAVRRYAWLVKLLARLKIGRTTRRLHDDVYYNSDIVQACILHPELVDRLNEHRPPANPPERHAA